MKFYFNNNDLTVDNLHNIILLFQQEAIKNASRTIDPEIVLMNHYTMDRVIALQHARLIRPFIQVMQYSENDPDLRFMGIKLVRSQDIKENEIYVL